MENDFESERKNLIRSLRLLFGKKIEPVDIETAVSEGIEAYIRASKDSPTEFVEAAYGYIYTAAKRAIIKRLRRAGHERPMSEVIQEPAALDPKERSFEAEDMVHEIFEHLSEDYQKVLLAHNEGYEIVEIAETMNRTVPATYKLLERAEKRFMEVGIKLGMSPPPAIVVPIETKLNLRKIENECRISRGIWPNRVGEINLPKK